MLDSGRLEEPGETTRRSVLARTVGAVGVIGGLGTFAGTASAWQWYDVAFEACSEVRIVIGEEDLEYDPPLQVAVVVASWGETTCRTVDIDGDAVATDDDRCGDSPVITYRASDAEKILGVVHYTPDGYPICLTENDNECTNLSVDPDAANADCVPDDLAACEHARGSGCPEDDSVGTRESPFVGRIDSRLSTLRHAITDLVGRR